MYLFVLIFYRFGKRYDIISKEPSFLALINRNSGPLSSENGMRLNSYIIFLE
jgi:hypothetical protein